MMMNLMTILVKKVFISSKPTFVYLLCPPLCGPFSIQESAAGGLSYKAKKNVPWHILAPRAVACDNLHLRASAHLWHVSAFLCNREFLGISCYIKKRFISPYVEMNLFLFCFSGLTPPVFQPERSPVSASGYGSSYCYRTLRSRLLLSCR